MSDIEETQSHTPLDKVIAQWEIDSPIDETNPGKEIIRIPNLHSKYAKMLSEHSRIIRSLNYKYNTMRKIRWEYYTGKLDKTTLDRYKWDQFPYTLKSDINYYMDADPELMKISAKRALHEEAFKYCEMIIKELNNRNYQIRAFIDWEKFVMGS
jgi:hypothetical protein